MIKQKFYISVGIGILFFFMATPCFATVYLEYNSAQTVGGTTGILNVYQPVSGAPAMPSATNRTWVKSKVFQYSGGLGTWDSNATQLTNIQDVTWNVPTVTSTDWAWINGSGDAGSWANYFLSGYNYVYRDPSTSGYVGYSAYASTTLSQNADVLGLAYYSVSNSGTIRVKINGVIQANVGNLDANGEYDTSTHTGASAGLGSSMYIIQIGANVHTGDVLIIEVKQYLASGVDRAYLYGIRYSGYTSTAVPSDPGWGTADNYQYEADGTSVTMSVTMAPQGDSGGFVGFVTGPAHVGHEYNASLTISVDGTPYTLGGNLNVGNVVSGNTITIGQTSTLFGTVSSTDDFADMTKTYTWTGSQFTRAWGLNFDKGKGVTASSFYVAQLYPNTTAGTNARYWGISATTTILMPTDGSLPGIYLVTPAQDSNRLMFFGGDVNVKASLVSENSGYGMQSGSGSLKLYIKKASWEKLWNSGETVSNSATITYSYEPPANINWTGKTLIVAKADTINDATEVLPFQNAGNYIKFYSGAGLTFSGVNPTNTYFTSLNDTAVGASSCTSFGTGCSTGSPAKGNWSGLTVTGAVNAYNNIISYATTSITASSNANVYHNSLNQNTIGINASSGSSVQNNALTNNTTSTTGAGSFDYNCYSGNAEETHGFNGNPLFTNAAGGDFSLKFASPCIDAGDDVGITTDYKGVGRYDYPFINNTGGGTHNYYDIGAYEYLGINSGITNTINSSGTISYSTYPTSSTTARSLSLTPSTGSVDAVINTWNTSGNYSKQWTETGSTSTISTVHSIGDLASSTYYAVRVDNNIYGTYQSTSAGQMSFTYTGGYSTHTFNLDPDTTPPTNVGISSITVNSTSTLTVIALAATDTESGLPTSPYWFAETTGHSGAASSTSWQASTTFVNSGLLANTQYIYEVKARDVAGNESAYSSSTSKYTSQNTPTGISFDSIGTDSLTVSAQGTLPNIASSSAGLYFLNTTSSSTPDWTHTNSWANSSLSPNTQYTYKVKARNGDSVETVYTATSSKYTLANIPNNLTFTINSDSPSSETTADWQANSNPAGTNYYIENTTAGTNSGWTTSFSWISTGLHCSKTYSFRIKAKNSEGTETSWSETTGRTRACGGGENSPAVTSPIVPPVVPSVTPGVAALQDQLDGLLATLHSLQAQQAAQQGSSASSYLSVTFNKDLRPGEADINIKTLQQYLNASGFILAKQGPGSPGNETNRFGALTRVALIKFQEAHAKEILAPVGLAKGTGFFGPSTRKYINSLKALP